MLEMSVTPKHLENLDQLLVTSRTDLLNQATLVLLHQSISSCEQRVAFRRQLECV